MQFYARYQDEVVSEPAAIAAHVVRQATARALMHAMGRARRRGPPRGRVSLCR